MIKFMLILVCTCQAILIAGMIMLACSPPDPPKPVPVVEEVKVIPERYEILYDRDSGECSVVTRSDNGLISESLFNSSVVNDCYEFTMINEKE